MTDSRLTESVCEIVDNVEWSFVSFDGKATIRKDGLSSAIPASTAGAVLVPETLGGVPVAEIGEKAFAGCSGVTRLLFTGDAPATVWVSSLDGEPIEGKEAIDSWTSEEGKSHRIVGKLEAGGEFVLIETTAPDGYEKAESITFTVGVDGTVKVDDEDVKGKVTMVDKEKTTKKTTKKTSIKKTKGGGTGDESGVMMVLTVFALAAAGLAATLIRRRRES